jgi:dienelactone hydrolase
MKLGAHLLVLGYCGFSSAPRTSSSGSASAFLQSQPLQVAAVSRRRPRPDGGLCPPGGGKRGISQSWNLSSSTTSAENGGSESWSMQDLEQLSREDLRSALSSRGLDPEGSRAAQVIRLGHALGLGQAAAGAAVPTIVHSPKAREPLSPQEDENRILHTEDYEEVQGRQSIPRGFTSMSSSDDSVYPGQPSSENRPLPPEESEVRKRVVVDSLIRSEEKFPDDVSGEEVDVYIVSTKKAARSSKSREMETHAILLLSDVFGWEQSATRAIADEISFICNAVVAVPDLFRSNPWDGARDPAEYELWRAEHPDERAADIVSFCALHVKKKYGAVSIGLLGFCYGGGRALEIAAASGAGRWEGRAPDAEPLALVAFYPTRYDPHVVGRDLSCATMVAFAGKDDTVGARPSDAEALQAALDKNQKVPSFMLRSFAGETHGFAHHPNFGGGVPKPESAEDALLLATVWFDLYLQKKGRTTGAPVRQRLS